MIVSNYRAQNSYEQRQAARNIAAYYDLVVRPDYHSLIQIYESPDELRQKEEAATLANVDAQEEFERHSPPDKLKIFIETLPNCLPLTTGSNIVDHAWAKIYFPCSKTMLGWATRNKCVKDNGEDYCQNKGYSPKSILKHLEKKEKKCMYHHAMSH